MVPTIDEFGGYSSRLRIPESSQQGANVEPTSGEEITESKKSKPRNIKNKAQNSANQNPHQMESESMLAKSACSLVRSSSEFAENAVLPNAGSANQSLCHLLGINVDEIALQIVIKDQTNREIQRCNQNKKSSDKQQRICVGSD